MKLAIIARWQRDVGPLVAQLDSIGWQSTVVHNGVDRPNVGREPAAFCHKLASLPLPKDGDTIACLQDGPFDHCKTLLAQLAKPIVSFTWLGDLHVSDGDGHPHDAGLAVKDLWERHTFQTFPVEGIMFAAGGQFAAPGYLLQQGRTFWETLEVWAGHGRHPWAMERCWQAIIDPLYARPRRRA